MQTVSIPRLKCSVPSEAVDSAIMYAVQELGYDCATPEQGESIHEFLLGVFVSLYPLEKARAIAMPVRP